MNQFRSLSVGALLLCTITLARAETFRIDPAQSVISFKVRHIFGSVNGKFRQFSGTIELDRDHPQQSSVNATIQVRSIETGIAKRDEHMKTAEFFDVAKFPEITFKSRSVKRTGKESGEVVGEFTMHGVTRTIPLQVAFLGFGKGKAGETTRWRVTTAPLKRSDYGLRWSPTVEKTSMIGEEVSVLMEIEASR